jgi:hypothetical protein
MNWMCGAVCSPRTFIPFYFFDENILCIAALKEANGWAPTTFFVAFYLAIGFDKANRKAGVPVTPAF